MATDLYDGISFHLDRQPTDPTDTTNINVRLNEKKRWGYGCFFNNNLKDATVKCDQYFKLRNLFGNAEELKADFSMTPSSNVNQSRPVGSLKISKPVYIKDKRYRLSAKVQNGTFQGPRYYSYKVDRIGYEIGLADAKGHHALTYAWYWRDMVRGHMEPTQRHNYI